MTKREAFEIVYRQLAAEYSASPDAFTKPGFSAIPAPASLPRGVRGYIRAVPFFMMACTGNSVTVLADKRLLDFLQRLSRDVSDLHRMLEFPAMLRLDAELRKYGYGIWGSEHFFLPGGGLPEVPMPEGLTYQWYDSESIKAFYPNERFRMALGAEYDPLRPDVIAIAAAAGNEIAGVAGASADTDRMWQVGIDVVEGYRGRGLGAALVSALSRRIIELGRLPYYGTAVGNLHSQAIAVKCGFVPAWAEVSAGKKESESIEKGESTI